MKNLVMLLLIFLTYLSIGILIFSTFMYWAHRAEYRFNRYFRYSVDDNSFISVVSIVLWPVVIPVRLGILISAVASYRGDERERFIKRRNEELERERREITSEIETFLSSST